jgi:crotonobetainyl-CoA:carnitine CoA-transferase CaiB-like acyl-CoA transferase
MLSGVKVLDLSQYLPGPFCSMILADLGADVIKVEHPRVGDPVRHMGARLPDTKMSGMFYQINRNKRSLALSLKKPEGQKIVRRLLAGCDVLLEGFRPGMLSELGLGYDDLKEEFPGLVYCSISGYGASGPYNNKAGHDGNYLAYSGLLSIAATQRPALPGFQLADIGGGSWPAVTGILAALLERTKSGKGRWLDISMLDGAFLFWSIHAGEFLATGQEPEPGRMSLNGGLPNYNIYQTADNRYVMFAALEERFLRAFFRRLEQEPQLDGLVAQMRQGNMQALQSRLTAIFSDRKLADWQPFFDDEECCLAPILSFSEACANEQIQARNMWHTPAGQSFPLLGSLQRDSFRKPAPELGQHTAEILAEAGFTAAEIADFRSKRIAG